LQPTSLCSEDKQRDAAKLGFDGNISRENPMKGAINLTSRFSIKHKKTHQ